MGKVSPFAPRVMPALPVVPGVRLATAAAGIKYKDRTDLLLAVFEPGTIVSGVFTQSKTASAPVEWCRLQQAGGSARALVVNSGNSNAFTGKQGHATVAATVERAAAAVGCRQEEVYVASTGVIGQPLDPSRFVGHLAGMAGSAVPEAWDAAARAIMTTDTYPKLATRTVRLRNVDVVINGIAKGAGMIAPDLATMFTFVFTDAGLAKPVLDTLLRDAVEMSLNTITIDGDTSTSDTVLAFATGQAAARGAPPITNLTAPAATDFVEAFRDLMTDLAIQIVKDGEGVSKFVTLQISGAETPHAARRIGFAIANSPLVKTAWAGSDPNWGRIVMAVGKSGEAADRDRLSIRFGDILVAEAGAVHPGYTEAAGAAYFKRPVLKIAVDVGVGHCEAIVRTCDLTADYVAINADYRS